MKKNFLLNAIKNLFLFFRYKVKTFEIEMDSELHGFGGYFECTLYKDIMISINPTTHSPGLFYFRSAFCLLFFLVKFYHIYFYFVYIIIFLPGMFSWFPIFFPLKAPMKLKEGDKLELHFWRLNNSKEVWYVYIIFQLFCVIFIIEHTST